MLDVRKLVAICMVARVAGMQPALAQPVSRSNAEARRLALKLSSWQEAQSGPELLADATLPQDTQVIPLPPLPAAPVVVPLIQAPAPAIQTPAASPAAVPLTPLAQHVAAGEAARKAGDLPGAQYEFEQALLLSPQQPEVLHALGLVEAYQKKYGSGLQHLAAALALAPGDVDIQLDQARVTAWNGDVPGAATAVDAILQSHPDNAEAWDLRARLHYYRGENAQAVSAARSAVKLDPLSTDFRITLAQCLNADGKFPEASTLTTQIQREKPDASELPDLLQTARDNRVRPWRVDLTLAHSSFERIHLSDWQGLNLQVSHALSLQDTGYARIENAQRFNQSNTTLMVGDYHSFGPGAGAYLEAGVTPGATFFPVWQVNAGGEWRVRPDTAWPGATFLTLDGRVAHYTSGTGLGFNPGVVQYIAKGQAWLTAHFDNSLDGGGRYLNGWSVRADALLPYGLDGHVGWGHAPESDGNSGPIAMVRAFTVGVNWPLNRDLSFHLDYLREDRSNSYLRHEVTLGGTWFF